jgi:calcium-dependent protein kinase
MDPLQDAVLKFYAYNLIQTQELEKIKEYFLEIDKDGDGMITKDEIEEIMNNQGRGEETEKIFELMNYDEDKDTISYQEFIKAIVDRQSLKSDENIKRCFEAIDIKKNNKLTIKEVANVVFTSKDESNIKDFHATFMKYSKGKDHVRLTS